MGEDAGCCFASSNAHQPSSVAANIAAMTATCAPILRHKSLLITMLSFTEPAQEMYLARTQGGRFGLPGFLKMWRAILRSPGGKAIRIRGSRGGEPENERPAARTATGLS